MISNTVGNVFPAQVLTALEEAPLGTWVLGRVINTRKPHAANHVGPGGSQSASAVRLFVEEPGHKFMMGQWWYKSLRCLMCLKAFISGRARFDCCLAVIAMISTLTGMVQDAVFMPRGRV